MTGRCGASSRSWRAGCASASPSRGGMNCSRRTTRRTFRRASCSTSCATRSAAGAAGTIRPHAPSQARIPLCRMRGRRGRTVGRPGLPVVRHVDFGPAPDLGPRRRLDRGRHRDAAEVGAADYAVGQEPGGQLLTPEQSFHRRDQAARAAGLRAGERVPGEGAAADGARWALIYLTYSFASNGSSV